MEEKGIVSAYTSVRRELGTHRRIVEEEQPRGLVLKVRERMARGALLRFYSQRGVADSSEQDHGEGECPEEDGGAVDGRHRATRLDQALCWRERAG